MPRFPKASAREIHEIFARKGFGGEVLDEIVRVITRDRRRWVDTMITEELGLRLVAPSPRRAAAVTFAAFCTAGLVPLLPFLLPLALTPAGMFVLSCLATAGTFMLVGAFKGHVLGRPRVRAGAETLLVGGAAAALAYGVGLALGRLIGTG